MNLQTINHGLALQNSSKGSGFMFLIIFMSRYFKLGAIF